MPSKTWFAEQRQLAAQWAQQHLDAGFVILDGETTGTRYDDEFVQIGILSSAGEILLDTLIKPTKAIDPGAERVHGLTANMLADAPGFPELYDQVRAILADQQVIAYNADFDSRILIQTIKRYGKEYIPGPPWDCAMLAYARFNGKWNTQYNNFKWIKLTDACSLEGITVSGAHSATGDCLMTLKVMQAMAATLEA